MKPKYNIKYIQKPGNKTKTPLYEIAPGTWVTRGNTPERKNWKKKWNEKPVNVIRNKKRWDKYYFKNKETINKRIRQRRNDNPEHTKKINDAWNSTEYGFMMNLYTTAKKDAKAGRKGKDPVPFEFTKKTWWEHWLKQKLIYGMKCPYSVIMGEPVEMTHIRGTDTGKKRRVIPTNISRDQIWPGAGYTKVNLIFCSAKFNINKNAISPAGCWAVIEIANQRMAEHHVEVKTGEDNFYGSKYHTKAIREHYLNALPEKYRAKIMEMAYLQSRLEKAKENNDLEKIAEVQFEINNFYEKK